jgi:hypothetical protein
LKFAAGFDEAISVLIVYQREQNESGIGLDAVDYLVELTRATDQGPHMFLGFRFGELNQTGASDRLHGFPRRVGHQVKMKLVHVRAKTSVDNRWVVCG